MIKHQYGESEKRQSINQSIFRAIDDSQAVSLENILKISEEGGHELKDVFSLIGLLSNPENGLLSIEFSSKNSEPVDSDVVYEKLRQYWKEKSLSPKEWKKWSSEIQVKWKAKSI